MVLDVQTDISDVQTHIIRPLLSDGKCGNASFTGLKEVSSTDNDINTSDCEVLLHSYLCCGRLFGFDSLFSSDCTKVGPRSQSVLWSVSSLLRHDQSKRPDDDGVTLMLNPHLSPPGRADWWLGFITWHHRNKSPRYLRVFFFFWQAALFAATGGPPHVTAPLTGVH